MIRTPVRRGRRGRRRRAVRGLPALPVPGVGAEEPAALAVGGAGPAGLRRPDSGETSTNRTECLLELRGAGAASCTCGCATCTWSAAPCSTRTAGRSTSWTSGTCRHVRVRRGPAPRRSTPCSPGPSCWPARDAADPRARRRDRCEEHPGGRVVRTRPAAGRDRDPARATEPARARTTCCGCASRSATTTAVRPGAPRDEALRVRADRRAHAAGRRPGLVRLPDRPAAVGRAVRWPSAQRAHLAGAGRPGRTAPTCCCPRRSSSATTRRSPRRARSTCSTALRTTRS